MNKQTIEEFCSDFGTTITEAELKLRAVVTDEETKYFTTKTNKGQCLQHLYFSIVSFGELKIENILEIGTGCGESTNVLSKLYPDSKIITFDLPKDDKDYKKLALRKHSVGKFCDNIADDNVEYYEMNSFFLLDKLQDKKFDLIWLDGGHNFPAVAWDMMYSYGSINKNGTILMHDYHRRDSYVKELTDGMEAYIPETMQLLPFAYYDTVAKMVWLRKQ